MRTGVRQRRFFGAAIISIYADAGITASPVDAWYSHHVSSGEIHCGTNVTRSITQPWWE
jgi:protein-arginine deiminase